MNYTNTSVFRDAVVDDFARILVLYGQLNPDDDGSPTAVLRAGFESILQREGLRLLVLEADGVVVATTYLNAAAFTLAAARLGVDPGDVVYVGDRLDVDARAATAAGMRGVWLNRSGVDAPPTGVTAIRTLRGLADVL